MQRLYKVFCFLFFGASFQLAYAKPIKIEGVDYSSQQTAQVAFKLSDTAHYKFFTLQNPSRLVIDFMDASLQRAITPPPAEHPLLVNVRSAVRDQHDLRVVLELHADADVNAHVVTTAEGSQLLVDLSAKRPLALKAASRPSAVRLEKTKVEKVAPESKTVAVKKEPVKGRDIVVAIDAGHGGKDVGAQGGGGTQEKDVVFAIAKRLERLVNKQVGMHAVMIRDGDYFVNLRERVRIARAAKADLFVSIHADAFHDATAHGASVYTLANKGASSEAARWLAASENASDLVGGVSLDDKDDALASVLLDLSKTAAKEASQNVGNKVLRHVKAVGHLHRANVQKAGFVVLKSPDIPSILVETAFISNPEEESNLNSQAYQGKMAAAIFAGIMSHFKQYAPANTLMAQMSKSNKALKLAAQHEEKRPVVSEPKFVANNAELPSGEYRHVIHSGETLFGIAQQYGVTMRALRTANDMNDSTVKVGQVLQIPRSI